MVDNLKDEHRKAISKGREICFHSLGQLVRKKWSLQNEYKVIAPTIRMMISSKFSRLRKSEFRRTKVTVVTHD